MAFSIRKFNNAEIPVDAKELLGKLQFISFIENFKMVDGSPVDYPTHAEVFSDKMQEIIPVKLEEGISVEDIPMISEVELVGDVTIWIYEDSYTISRGNNNVSEVKGHAFALRAENVKRVGGGQPKQEQKQDQKSEQKQEHKG
jgi:hypothetical protein